MVGVFCPNLQVVEIEMNCSTEQLRESCRELMKLQLLYLKKYDDSDIYFILPERFSNLPKSDKSVALVRKHLSSLPEELVVFLSSIGIKTDRKVVKFIEPTKQEVIDYSLSKGYLIDADTFISFYQENALKQGKKGIWVDSRGKQVKDWKSKLRTVWFKEEKKLKFCKEAPKGFETFHIFVDGKVVQPDGWRNGKPYSKSIGEDVLLKKGYVGYR